MSKIVTVTHIEMYCKMLHEKMWKQISEAQIGDEISLKSIKTDINKKYGIDKLEKEINKISTKRDEFNKKVVEDISNLRNKISKIYSDNKINEEINERYKTACLSPILKEEMKKLETQIRLSTSPDDIKEIFRKLDE